MTFRGSGQAMIHFLSLLLFFSISALVYFPVQRTLSEKTEGVKREFLGLLEDKLKRKIAYESISPSLFRYLEIHNLSLTDPKGERLTTIRKARIYYDVFSLFKGESIPRISEISIENSTLVIDTRRDKDLIDFLFGRQDRNEATKEASAGEGLSMPSVRVVGRNLNVVLRTEDEELSAEKLFLSLQPGKEAAAVRLRGGLAYRSLRPESPLQWGRTFLDFRGQLGNSFERSEAQVSLSRFSTNLLELRRQTFRVVFDGSVLSVRKVQDNSPFDAGLSYAFASRTLKVNFLSSRFKPSSVVSFRDSLAPLNEWLDTVLSAKGDLSYDLGSGRFAYTLDFDGSMRNSIVRHETSFSGRANGDEGSVQFSPLKLSNRFGDVAFNGNVTFASNLPEGRLEIARLALPGLPTLAGEFKLERAGKVLSFAGPRLGWGREALHSIDGRLLIEDGTVHLDAGLAFDEGGRSSLNAALMVPLDGKSDFTFGGSFSSIPVAKLLDVLGEVSAIEGLPAVEYDLKDFLADGRVNGSLKDGGLAFTVPELTLRTEKNAVNYVALAGSYDRGNIDVFRWRFFWDAYYGEGDLQGRLGNSLSLDFESRLSVLDVPYELAGIFDPSGRLKVKGQYGLAADFSWKDRGPLYGDISLTDFPLPMLQKDAKVSSRLEVFFEDLSSWTLEVRSLELSGLRPFAQLPATVEIVGTFGPYRGTMKRLVYRDRYSELLGTGELRYTLGSFALNGNLSLAEKTGKERYNFSFAADETAGSGVLVFSGSPLERFALGFLNGRASGTLSVKDLPRDPDVRLSLALEDGTVNDVAVTASLAGRYFQDRFTLDSLDFRYQSFQLHQSKVSLDLAKGRFDAATIVTDKWTLHPIDWQVGFHASFDANAGILEAARLPFEAWSGYFEVTTVAESVDPLFRGWTVRLRREKDKIDFSGGPGEGVKGSFRDNGEFTLLAQEPLPITFDASGTLTWTTIEADVNKIFFRAEKIPKLLDLTVVKFLRGQASGNIRVSGPIRDPDFFGALTATQVFAKVEIIPEELGPCKGYLIFRGKEFVLQPMAVPVVNGLAEIRGSFLLDQWVPQTYSLDIDTKASEGVHVKYAFGPVNLNGYGRGLLSINGDMRKAKVSGKITASHTIITIGDLNAVNQPPSADSQAQTAILLNLDVESGKAVEFFWPNTDFPILRTFADTGQKLSIQLDSETTDFRVLGDIRIMGGEVFYFDRSFYLRQGMIRFNERKELFDPMLTARAEIRESTDAGLVRIYLVADNTKLSQFTPRFESDSALSNPEILAILGKNVFTTSEGGDSVNFSSALAYTSDVLSQIGFVRDFERDMRERLNVDLFSFRTHIVQNVLQEAMGKSNTTETSTATNYNDVSFGRYLDKTSVFLGKYLSKDIFLELMMQFYARDPLTQRTREFGGMDIESEFMLEWKTPFFLLEWTLSPNNLDQLFVRDMKFSFKWKFSF